MNKSLDCDFEGSYACGFQHLVDGRVQWERLNAGAGNRKSPKSDASSNIEGNTFVTTDTGGGPNVNQGLMSTTA